MCTHSLSRALSLFLFPSLSLFLSLSLSLSSHTLETYPEALEEIHNQHTENHRTLSYTHTLSLSFSLSLSLSLAFSLSLSLTHTHTYTHTHTHTHRTFQDAVEDIYTLSQNYPEIEGHLEGPALLRHQQRMLTKEPYTCEKRPAKEPCIYQKQPTKEPTCKMKQLSRNRRPPRRPHITWSLTTYAYKGAL